MGDDEFENFLNERNRNDPMVSCQKRLLFDIIKQKMDGSIDMISVLSDLYSKLPDENFKNTINELLNINKTSFEQLEYVMSLLLDEINGGNQNDTTNEYN